jgi:hypothetical protein
VPDQFCEPLCFSSTDEVVERFRAFVKAHADFEPAILCERDGNGRRRWVLTVGRRTRDEADEQQRRRRGASDEG